MDRVQVIASLFNKITFTVSIDNQILQQEDCVAITLMHKPRFRHKLRRLTYTTSGTSAVVNGTPGPIQTTVGELYTDYKIEIDVALQDLTWLGLWDVYIAIGDYSNPKVTVQLKDYIVFVKPILDTTLNNDLQCSITKAGGLIFIGRFFTLNESELDGRDRLATGLI